jgi:hypothetical protein
MNDLDTRSDGRPPAAPGIQWGMAGWDTDGGDPLDLGNATNDPADGPNLCRVTLFSRRDAGAAFDQSKAQGLKILCRLADGVRFPTAGTLVVVAIPEPFGNICGVILGTCSSNPSAQGNAAGDALVLQSPSGKAAIILRGDNIVLKTAAENGATIYQKVGPRGFQFVAPFGTIALSPAHWSIRHASGTYITGYSVAGLPAPLNALGSIVKISGAIAKVDGTKVLLGPDTPATNYQPVPTGLPADTGGTPLFSAYLTAMADYNTKLAACIASLVPASGVTAAQQSAFATSVTTLTSAITADEGVVTSSSVAASIP